MPKLSAWSAKRPYFQFAFFSLSLNLVLSFFFQIWMKVGHIAVYADSVNYSVSSEIDLTLPLNPNQPINFKTIIKPSSDISNRIIDLEIYDQNNQRVFQQFYDNQTLFSGRDNQYSFNWTPQPSGRYRLKVGIFTPNWQETVYWNDNILPFSLNQSVAPIPTGPSQPNITLIPTAYPTITLTPIKPNLPGTYTVGTDGRIYKNGQKITLQGVSWFGAESDTKSPHGLWARNWQDMIGQIKSSGFNAVRLPYCPSTLKNVAVSGVNYDLNPDLRGLNSLDILDKVVTKMASEGIYVLLDQHTQNCQYISDLPQVDGYSQSDWINDLSFVARRYAHVSNFIGIDIKNEPKGVATWGTGNSDTDWNRAAENAGQAILVANPDILVFVQGIENNPTCSDNRYGHWWGGSFEPLKCTPLDQNKLPSSKVVYSPHVYGPDVHPQTYFSDAHFPNNLPPIWEQHFGFLKDTNKAVAIGEFGGKYGSGDSRDVAWQNKLVDYLSSKGICDNFYWSWNPNSGDTGGILNDDWTTVRQDKLNLLARYRNQCQ